MVGGKVSVTRIKSIKLEQKPLWQKYISIGNLQFKTFRNVLTWCTVHLNPPFPVAMTIPASCRNDSAKEKMESTPGSPILWSVIHGNRIFCRVSTLSRSAIRSIRLAAESDDGSGSVSYIRKRSLKITVCRVNSAKSMSLYLSGWYEVFAFSMIKSLRI